MPHEIGDVIITNGWPGHVMMVYTAGNDNAGTAGVATIIHAQGRGRNFHIEPIATFSNGTYGYATQNARVFRPPWERIGGAAGPKRAIMQRIARAIRDSAEYGIYRAIRLCVGSSKYGSGARARLAKYRSRMSAGFHDFLVQGKFVTTVTCSEAVILCYQLAFDESDEPFFIKLDAAHSMPRTLAKYCSENWQTLQ